MPSVPIEISARHIHLTEADWNILFGDTKIISDHAISQPKQFVAKQRVTLRGPKGEIKGVAVVGPFRPNTQVELAMTDVRALGVAAPLCDSGKLDQAAEIIIVGSRGEIVRAAAIVPQRHIHLSPKEATAAGLRDRQTVSVRITGPRGAQLDNVLVRVHHDFTGRLHLDTDEGNTCGVTAGMSAELIA
ncbi:MAG: PduL/EutD family phosphate acyltransferase [Patescibacteria group bacterium]